MVSKSNYVFIMLILISLISLTSSRLKNRRSKSFLETQSEEELKEKEEEAKQLEREKELDKLLEQTKAKEYDNNYEAEMQLTNFLTQISDTSPEYLTSVKKEPKKPVIEDKESIWQLTSIEKTQRPIYY